MNPRRVIDRIRARLASLWKQPGLTPEQERRFDIGAAVLVALFVVGWIFAIIVSAAEGITPRAAGRIATSPFAPDAPPEAAFLLDAVIRRLAGPEIYGVSGAVRVVIREPGDTLVLPDTLPPGVGVELEPVGPAADTAPPTVAEPGVWNVILRMGNAARRVPGLTVITLRPLSEARGGRLGEYLIGEWPEDRPARLRTPAYDPPSGLVQVTPENQDLRVSEHFRLRDFLTKGQAGVWPKYVALSPRLLDKLELTMQELEAAGHPVENVGVISGFRTPYYNRHGGDPSGRGGFSRHMYGDAMDLYIDNDRDGQMDDLDGDGRVDVGDARVIARAAERVERRYPHLVGGIGIYRPARGAHSGFVHIDTRGYRARW